MTSSRDVEINLYSVKQIKSKRRASYWCPKRCSVAEKMSLGITSLLIIAGLSVAVIVPFIYSISKTAIQEETLTAMITQTVTTATTTTVTSTTTSTTTSSTSTTTSTTPRLPISLLATVTASNYSSGAGSAASQGDSLVDRTQGGGGLSTGLYAPQYVQLELPGLYNIYQVYLCVGQLPNGVTTHQLNVGSNLNNLSLVTNMNGYTIAGQWINITYLPVLTNVRFLRLDTISSPSWVAWVKFIVYDQ